MKEVPSSRTFQPTQFLKGVFTVLLTVTVLVTNSKKTNKKRCIKSHTYDRTCTADINEYLWHRTVLYYY